MSAHVCVRASNAMRARLYGPALLFLYVVCVGVCVCVCVCVCVVWVRVCVCVCVCVCFYFRIACDANFQSITRIIACVTAPFCKTRGDFFKTCLHGRGHEHR